MKLDAHTMLEREIAIMKKINHPNIVRLYEVIENPSSNKLFMVLEYMDQGAFLSDMFFSNVKPKDNIILGENKSID